MGNIVVHVHANMGKIGQKLRESIRFEKKLTDDDDG